MKMVSRTFPDIANVLKILCFNFIKLIVIKKWKIIERWVQRFQRLISDEKNSTNISKLLKRCGNILNVSDKKLQITYWMRQSFVNHHQTFHCGSCANKFQQKMLPSAMAIYVS